MYLMTLMRLFTCCKGASLSLNVPKLQLYQFEKLGTSNDVESFAIGSDLWRVLLLKEQMMTSVKEVLKMLV